MYVFCSLWLIDGLAVMALCFLCWFVFIVAIDKIIELHELVVYYGFNVI